MKQVFRLLAGIAIVFVALVAASVTVDADDRPNILFLIADDWGWNHAGAYGCRWVHTPTFDRMAAEGALFRNCFTTNPKCSPCRATILTGRNTWQLEEACCHFGIFPSKFAVYPDLLEKAGYAVGCTGKGWGPGDWKSGGFRRNPAGTEFNKHKQATPLKFISNIDYAKNLEEFLATRKSGQPFCFWVGTHEPHRPYHRDAGLAAGRSPRDVEVPKYLPNNDLVRRDFLDYGLEVEWHDQQCGKVLEALDKAGELDRTLVVMTSDHGIPFPHVKGQIFEDGFHLPLAIRWPGKVKPGRSVDDFVSASDFAPTFLAAAGLPRHAAMSGSSIMPLLTSDRSGTIDAGRNVIIVAKERHDLGRPHDWGYPVRAIRTTEFLFVHNYEPDRWPAGNPETGYRNCDDGPTKTYLVEEEKGKFYELSFGKRPEFALFDIRTDPACIKNLAGEAKHAAVIADLRGRMERTLQEQGDPRALGKGEVFDTYKYVGSRENKGYDEWLRSQKKP